MKRCSSLAVCTLLFAIGCGAEEADANPNATARLAQEETPEEPTAESFLVGAVTGKVGDATLSGKVSIERFFDEKGTVFAIGRFADVTGVSDAVSKALTAQTIKLPVWVSPEGGIPADGAEFNCEALTLLLQPLRINLSGTAVTLDKVDLDVSATPGGAFVIASVLCPEPGLFARGGRLSDLKGDMETVLSILNGLTGLPFADVPLNVPTVSADPVSATKPATTTPASTPATSPAGTATKSPTSTPSKS